MKRILGIGALVICAVMVVFIVVIASPATLPSLDADALLSFEQTTIIYDRLGSEVASLYSGENRRLTPLENVSGGVIDAFLACEDSRFYEHRGIDLVRLIGATLANVKSGDYSQGASTITQQLIKLTYLTPDKTLTRKIHEAILALELETKLSKDEILTLYLNRVYFGGGAYGVASAAKFYFDADIADVSLAQAALLAAIVKSPTRYAPHIQPENARKRRDLVLNMMLEKAYITQTQYDAAIKEPLGVVKSTASDIGAWYTDEVLREAETLLNISADDIFSSGYRIYTALEPQLQEAAEHLFDDETLFPANAADDTPVQAAFAAVEVSSGEVLCLIGGREYSVKRGMNRATQAYRQPGSIFKPLVVYAPAIERFSYMPTTLLDDQPEEFPGGYAPQNAGGTYAGVVTLRDAIANSLNIPAVHVLNEIGILAGFSAALRAGITLDKRDSVLPLALGALTKGVTTVAMANAYTQFASGGEINDAHTIRQIVNSRGSTIYEYKKPATRIISPATAYIMTDMLLSAVKFGTARVLNGISPVIAAKTGSVAMQGGGNRDAWIAAYTPNISICVWMGFDNPDDGHKLPERANGGNQPARLVADFMRDIPKKWITGQYARPSGIVEAVIDKKALLTTGNILLAGENTPKDQAILEVFRVEDRPTEVSELYAPPLPVENLEILRAGEYPVVRFTAPEDGVQYRILQETASGSREIALLNAGAGEVIAWEDRTLPLNEARAYAVIPIRAGTDAQGQPRMVSMEGGSEGLNIWDSLFSPFSATSKPTSTPEPIEEDVPLFR